VHLVRSVARSLHLYPEIIAHPDDPRMLGGAAIVQGVAEDLDDGADAEAQVLPGGRADEVTAGPAKDRQRAVRRHHHAGEPDPASWLTGVRDLVS
jgi:hypothetical protein